MSVASDQDLSASLLRLFEARSGQSLGVRKLLQALDLPPHQSRRLRRLLKGLVDEGRLIREGRGRYSLAGRREEQQGTLGRPRSGFVPLEAADGSVLLRIPYQDLGGALPGDSVLAERTRRRSAPPHNGRVLGITARGQRPIVGLLRRQAKGTWLVPDDERLGGPLLIRDAGPSGARDGQVVAAVIDDPRPTARPRARVVRVLGEPGELATEVERLLLEHGLERDFPPAVEAEQASEPVDRRAGRRADLSRIPLVTIDPPDAKDHDDAVFAQAEGDGFRLWVAIADVAAHLPPGSATDREAARRGCSRYLPGTVFPMLPARLSEQACSLLPGRKRGAVCLELELDRTGRLRGGRARWAWIRSAARLSYPEVQAVLDGRPGGGRAEPLAEQLHTMARCAGRLLSRMKRRGQLVFDLPELQVELDGEGWPRQVQPAPVGLANRLIEAFMVAANEAVAGLLHAAGGPALYRVHPPPEAEKIEAFAELAGALGAPPPFGRAPRPGQVAAYLDELRSKPVGPPLEQLLLRSLMQARYSDQPGEHYGLASPLYLHFTSPIRRYPDLAVHRQLGRLLDRAGPEGVALASAPPALADWPLSASRVAELAESCSQAERQALAAEREALDLYQAAFLSDHLGEELDGRVSFVADFGLFVRLEPSGIEGMVHLSRMREDYYDYDDRLLALIGRRSGRSFRVGQPVRVRVASVNLSQRQIDLELAAAPSTRRKRR